MTPDMILKLIEANPTQALNILEKFIGILEAHPEILTAILGLFLKK